MNDILYYPLLDKDSSGKEKQPMFPSKDENTVKENHKMWLKVIIPEYYRLCSAKPVSPKDALKLNIRCPACGEIMRPITKATKGNTLPLFVCDYCMADG